MSDFWTAALTAFGMILVIEGLFYALFPNGMKRLIVSVLDMPSGALRWGGVIALVIGVVVVWLVRGA